MKDGGASPFALPLICKCDQHTLQPSKDINMLTIWLLTKASGLFRKSEIVFFQKRACFLNFKPGNHSGRNLTADERAALVIHSQHQKRVIKFTDWKAIHDPLAGDHCWMKYAD